MQRVDNVFLNFLSPEDVNPGAAARLKELREAVEMNEAGGDAESIEREILFITGDLRAEVLQHAKTCDEVHGITRKRIFEIMEQLDQGISPNEDELNEDPSIYAEVRNYLMESGIKDRLSFEQALFDWSNTHWYGKTQIGNVVPKNLVEIVCGRKMTHVTDADLVAMGDKLFGKFDVASFVDEVRGMLSERGVTSREDVLNLTRKDVSEVAKGSRAGSSTILFRIIAGKRPGLLHPGGDTRGPLADILFPEKQAA